MSESESDVPPPPPAEAGPLFPIDGKFKSEEERAQIMALPEVERESFLADRSEEIQEAAQSAQLRQLMANRAKQDSQKKRKADEVEEDDKPQPKRTAKTKTSENIANYKRLREERHEQRKRGDNRRARNDLTPSPSDRDRDRDSDRDVEADSEEVEWEDRRRASPMRREPPPLKRDIDRVRVGRSNFHKVCLYPGFEDAITGCFCRVAIGPSRSTGEPQYRMTQIKGFTTGREYKMDVHNGRPFKTNQYAILAHGKAEKEWPFTACSDSNFSVSEYERYMSTIQSEGLKAPSVSLLSDKCQDITSLLNRPWTSAEITERLKRMNGTTIEQDEISPTEPTRQLPIAHESSSRPSPSEPTWTTNGANAAGVMTQQQRLAALNDRNRRANAEAIRKAQTEERKKEIELKAKLEKGDGEVNPFARVKSKARGMLDVNRPRAATPLPAEDKNKAKEANGAAADASKVEKPKLKPQQKKRVMDDEVYCNLDSGIDVEI